MSLPSPLDKPIENKSLSKQEDVPSYGTKSNLNFDKTTVYINALIDYLVALTVEAGLSEGQVLTLIEAAKVKREIPQGMINGQINTYEDAQTITCSISGSTHVYVISNANNFNKNFFQAFEATNNQLVHPDIKFTGNNLILTFDYSITTNHYVVIY